MVLNCAGETRKRDVTTMFTYSHANTPLGQSERAHYLSYFITENVSIMRNFPVVHHFGKLTVNEGFCAVVDDAAKRNCN